jgi:hypothetical protein
MPAFAPVERVDAVEAVLAADVEVGEEDAVAATVLLPLVIVSLDEGDDCDDGELVEVAEAVDTDEDRVSRNSSGDRPKASSIEQSQSPRSGSLQQMENSSLLTLHPLTVFAEVVLAAA